VKERQDTNLEETIEDYPTGYFQVMERTRTMGCFQAMERSMTRLWKEA